MFAKSAKVEDRSEDLKRMLEVGFHRITFAEASRMISEAGHLDKVEDDFTREHELYLCDKLGKGYTIQRPFYRITFRILWNNAGHRINDTFFFL